MSRIPEVRTLDPSEYSAWNALVEDSPTGSPYASPEYLDALSAATGGRFAIRAAFRGSEIVGGIPLYQEDEGLQTIVSPRLLLFYNGPVLRAYASRYPGENMAREIAALTALEASLREEPFGRVALKARSPLVDVRPFLAQGWEATPCYTLVVPLDDLERLWSRMDRNARRLIRRAEEMKIQVDRDEDFASFFRLHRRTHERKNAPLYLPGTPFRRFFERAQARSLARLYHARSSDGRVLSSQMVLANGHPVTHTLSAAADEAHANTGATPYLRWKVFEDLHSEGFLANDLTGAELGSVTRFKHQFGGELEVSMEVSRTRAAFRALRVPKRLNRRGRGWATRLLAPLRSNDHVR